MATSRKIMTAALAATIAITMLSISSPASAWSRCGRNLGPGYYGMALGAAAPSPYSYGYYGSANPSGYGYYGFPQPLPRLSRVRDIIVRPA